MTPAGRCSRPNLPSPLHHLSTVLREREIPLRLSCMKLTGKVALITNVSEFMGPAITEEFCREGAAVALHDRDEAAAKPFAGIAAGLGRERLVLGRDVSLPGQ